MPEKFSDIVSSEENVARIIFSPSYIFDGRGVYKQNVPIACWYCSGYRRQKNYSYQFDYTRIDDIVKKLTMLCSKIVNFKKKYLEKGVK